MIEIKGKYNKDCKVYAKTIEDKAMSTIYNICDNPAFKGQKIRIMPDCHEGKGIVIGFSSTIDKNNPLVNPSHVGVDIGCQVTCIEMSKACPEDKFPLLEHRWHEQIPMGFKIHQKNIASEKTFYKMCNDALNKAIQKTNFVFNYNINEEYITNLLNRIGMGEGMFWRSLGTVGGGNHFLAYDTDDEGKGYIMIHCGSRNFGLKVAKYWMNKADKRKEVDTDVFAKEIDNIKKSYPKSEWNIHIKEAKEKIKNEVHVGYLSGQELMGYLTDMVVAQTYASYNHDIISHNMVEIYKNIVKDANVVETINTMHNYIDFDDMIIRKGAVNASKSKKLVIPINMRDGVLVCEGKGNDNWNCTAPHGAGRLMSRSKAKSDLSINEFVEEMKNVYSTTINTSTLDEAPMAYKPIEEIIDLIEPTVTILKRIYERINIKATD